MLDFLWQTLIFRPLLNLLIGLYNTIGFENLGLAVIWLTMLVRLALLPLSLKDAARLEKERKMKDELKNLQRMFANNPSVLRDEQRKLMSSYRFRRWPRIIVLGTQAVIFVVLYQVFIHGIKLSQVVDALYSFVRVPFIINTNFLGFDVSKHSLVLSGLCGAFLFANIWLDHQLENRKWTQSDLLFLFGFPAATFIVLYLLPSVKSLFILSSMIFSDLMLLVSVFRESIKEQEHIMHKRHTEHAEKKAKGIPHPTERFR